MAEHPGDEHEPGAQRRRQRPRGRRRGAHGPRRDDGRRARQGREVGERLPDVVEAVRAGATDRRGPCNRARARRSWSRFSLGLGIGLTLTGAPRLPVAARSCRPSSSAHPRSRARG
jgi:hypothetical protein